MGHRMKEVTSNTQQVNRLFKKYIDGDDVGVINNAFSFQLNIM